MSPSPSIQFRKRRCRSRPWSIRTPRADFFVSFGQEGASLEEGYVTFPTVPGGLLVKAGKMRTAFGKTNPLHPHALPWPDRPLVSRNLLGGDEGIADAGVSVARTHSQPVVLPRGHRAGVPRRSGSRVPRERGQRSQLPRRLRAYQDVTESTNIDVGASFSMGHNDAGVDDGVDVGRFTTRICSASTRRCATSRCGDRSTGRSSAGANWCGAGAQQLDGVAAGLRLLRVGRLPVRPPLVCGLRYDRSDRRRRARRCSTPAWPPC